MYTKNEKYELTKKQKIVYCCIIGFFISIVFLAIIPSAEGWHNNTEGYSPPSHWGTYSYDRHYGTHDWIADFALKEIEWDDTLAEKWKLNNGQDNFWTESRRRIYLYGTEGPDSANIYYRSGFTVIRGESDPSGHHIWFYDNEYIRNKHAADKAFSMASKAVHALDNGECEIAAFYLGQMTHYIADLSNFFHVLHRNEVKYSKQHYNYEKHVNQWTSYDSTTECGDTTFFFWECGFSVSLLLKDPTILAIDTAYRNRFGDDNHFSAKEFQDRYHWIKRAYYWRLRDRNEGSKSLFDTIEWNLNNAIDCCAAALDWVIRTSNFQGCKYNEDDYVNIYDDIVDQFGRLAALNFTKVMIFIGNWAVVYAGVMTTSDKILEAPMEVPNF